MSWNRSNGKATAKYRRQRRALYSRQDGLCYYCERPMILIEMDWQGVTPPDNLCTTEHLDDKYDVRRGKNVNGKYRRVAACRACNLERSKRRVAAKHQIRREGING